MIKKILTHKEKLIIILVGLYIGSLWWVNKTLVYDDINLPNNFEALNDSIGWVNSFIKIFALDLPNEYRTYGISRSIQFLLWSFGLSNIYVYTLIIIATHIVTSFYLYNLNIRLGINNISALFVSLIWVCSPFIWTSCFHHYSYLILPVQILIIGISLAINDKFNLSVKSSVIFGFLLALTGEMQVIAAPLAMLLVSRVIKSNRLNNFFKITVLSQYVVITIHFLIWKFYVSSEATTARFSIKEQSLYSSYTGLLTTLNSIVKTFLFQFELVNFIFFALYILPIFLLFYLYINIKLKEINYSNNLIKFSLGYFLLSISFLLIYVLTVVISNSIPDFMPRRYGYIPFTLILISFYLLIDSFTKKLRTKIIVSLFYLFVVLFITSFWQLVNVNSIKKNDLILQNIIPNAAESKNNSIIFIASDQRYPTILDYYSSGPAMGSMLFSENTQARFSTYWPYQLEMKLKGYLNACGLTEILQFDSIVNCPKWQSLLTRINNEDTIVIANLGFNKEDIYGKNLRVFKNIKEFEPYFFSKFINKNVINYEISSDAKSLAIDLGNNLSISTSLNSGVLYDKEFFSPFNGVNFIKNYGLISGINSTYSNPNINPSLYFYRTNRNGDFIYQILFDSYSKYRISFIFWEQWQKANSQRIFDLDVSWDGLNWVNVGEIDPYRINQNMPFSVDITKNAINKIYFRLVKKEFSADISMIQGVIVEKF
ncbi:hypothetical protein PHIN6_03070 [Polynucleobacter sp. HIN6]|uniref:hypothetical protein n=1 Tax=Polynucleobacter sp. HIN6 TaxID=3047865 RepID=UPI0025730F9A|nr:hypothetical protein [Polynucleobacter sp. HIN6]BEI34789.1 hypothetical protein PHIN6_03070 [Polynucleobacter sp. HIN6]